LVLFGALWSILAGLGGLLAHLLIGATATPPLQISECLGLLGAGTSLLLGLPEAFRPTDKPGRGRSRRWRRWAIGSAFVPLVIGLIGLFASANGGAPGLPPLPQLALACLFILSATALFGWRTRRHLRAVQLIMAVVGFGAWFFLLAGAFGAIPAGSEERFAFSLVPASAVFLAAGMIALRPFEGVMRLAVAGHLAGRMFRRIVPMVLGLPFLIAAIRLGVAHRLPLSAGLVMSVVTLLIVLGLIWISLANAMAIDTVDRERRQLALRAERLFAEAGQALDQAHTFFEGSPVCMLVLTGDGRIEALNGQAERVFGWPREMLTGRLLTVLAASGQDIPWNQLLQDAGRSTEAGAEGPLVELACQRRDGGQFFAEGGYRVSSRGRTRFIVVHLRDISSRKRFEQQLALREHRLLEAQRLGRLGYWDWDAATDSVTWSEGLCQIMEHPVGQPAPRLFAQLDRFSPESRAFLEHALRRATVEGVPYRLELTLLRRDGVRRDVLATGEARAGRAGEVIGLFGAVQDITENKATRRALEAASERLHLATQAARIGVWDWDVANDRLEWDDRTLEIYARTRVNFGATSRNWHAMLHPEDADRFQAELHTSLSIPGGLHTEFRIRRPDGNIRHVRCDGIVQKDIAGRPTRLLGTQLDVTDQREAEARIRRSEQALRESEERFRLAFESAGIGMALVSPEGRWLKANRTLCSTLGYSQEELLGKTAREITHPDDIAQGDALRNRVLAGDLRTYQRSKRYFSRNGKVVWALVTVALVRDTDDRPLYFVSLIEDITQRRETESRVKTLNDQLRGILQFSPSLVTLFDREGRYLLVSRSVEAALGKSAAEIIGKTLEDVLPAEAASLFRRRLERLAGSLRPFVVEDVRGRAGEERTYLTTLFPLYDAEGRHVASGGVATDITDQRQAHRVAEEALREKEILLQEIHHRVKNNLQIISSLLQLESRAVADPEARIRFEDCQGRVQAMALIHERLYRTGDLSCIDLGAYLESLAGQIIRSFGRVPGQMLQPIEVTVGPVAIETAVPCGLIVAELVTNALKHAFPNQRRGELAIRLVADQGQWILSVADNGVGGAAEGREGSLGLKLVSALARQLRGSVEAENRSGMTVKVSFPAPISRQTDS
jgi:PAS domain S-box-containing protein